MDTKELQEVKSLIVRLKIIAAKLDDVESNLLDKLDEGDDEANEQLDKEIEIATQKYYQIGLKLNTLGGFDLMQYCLYQVPNEHQAQTVINSAWNGIGKWLF